MKITLKILLLSLLLLVPHSIAVQQPAPPTSKQELTPATQLADAVRRGDAATVRELLLRGGATLPTNHGEYLALLNKAVLSGNPDILDYIPYVEPVAGHTDSALIVALRAEVGPRMVAALLAAGARPDDRAVTGKYKLHSVVIARQSGDHVSAELLLAAEKRDFSWMDQQLKDDGVEEMQRILSAPGFYAVDQRVLGGYNPLIAAARAGQVELVRLLLAAGADPHALDAAGNNALTHAIDGMNDPQVISMLQAAGCKQAPMRQAAPNPEGELQVAEYFAPIQQALEQGNAEYFLSLPRPLLEYAIMPLSGAERFHDSGRALGRYYMGTPLMVAAANGQPDVLRVLLARGADIEADDFFGRTAIVYAAANGHADCVRLLLTAGSKQVESALRMAAYAGQHDVVDFLLERGVRPGLAVEWALMSENPHPALMALRQPDADLALSLAVCRNHPGLVTRLVQLGADVNRPNFYPLHEWVDSFPWTNDAVLPELLRAGADINRKRNGQTAVEYARTEGNSLALELLQSAK